MPSLRFLGILLILWTALPAQAAESHVQLVLDASGSMWNKLDDGRFRITAAKDVMERFIEGLPDDGMHVGLRIYGAEVKAGRDGACRDTRLVVPMEGVHKVRLQKAVKDAQALGATPIALSLEKAAADFPADARKKLIVLVTDGKESCDGDLKAVAAELAGIDLKIIGFDLEADAAASFEGLGSFENASDAKALGSALGRAVADVVPPLGEATLEAPAEVGAGSMIEIRWTGPDGPQDYITLVEAGKPDGHYQVWQYTRDGNPLELAAPLKAGDYELRYQSDRVPGVAARRAIQVTPTKFGVSAPSRIEAGSVFPAKWQGPNGEGDYITIVPEGADAGAYKSYFYTRDGSPGELSAPIEPGNYEVRYQSEREDGIFASVPVTVEASRVVLEAPASVAAGSTFEVQWSGPDGKGDWITIVAPDAGVGAYKSYAYTRDGSPVTLTAPDAPGEYEIRYASDRVRGTFASRSIRVE